MSWLCRHGIHLWRLGERDRNGRRTYVCRWCKVFGLR